MNILTSRLNSALSTPVLEPTKKSTSLHPSSASIEVPDPTGGTKIVGTCLRQQYYRAKCMAVTNAGIPDWTLSAKIGDKLHGLLEELVDIHGFSMGLQKLASEHPFYDPRIGLSGRSDLILWDHMNAEPIGLEIKSVGEYKANKVLQEPAEEHVMQAMLYLDYYRNAIPEGQTKPTKWYIWYIARTENWSIKGKKHGSPMVQLWDYYVTLDEEGVPTIHGANSTQKWTEFSVEKIHNRYKELQRYIDEGEIPERDFELAYTEEKLTAMYKLDLLTRKTDKETIRKWLKKGAPEGELARKLSMGDFNCQLCSWKALCWDNQTADEKFYNLPETCKESVEEDPKTDLLL